MSNLIQFTNNTRDCSTDQGYQFEFCCDGCGTGLMSRFKASKLGMAGGFLRAASNIFGGLGSAGDSARDASELMRGKERDEALRESVEEAKKVFKLCGRCGNWVCPQACWNDKRNMCETCAPDLEEEMIAAQNTARKEQIWQKARQTDMLGGMDVTSEQGFKAQTCTGCGAQVAGKFCASCGTAVVGASKKFCPNCGVEGSPGSKFCGGCGTKMD